MIGVGIRGLGQDFRVNRVPTVIHNEPPKSSHALQITNRRMNVGTYDFDT